MPRISEVETETPWSFKLNFKCRLSQLLNLSQESFMGIIFNLTTIFSQDMCPILHLHWGNQSSFVSLLDLSMMGGRLLRFVLVSLKALGTIGNYSKLAVK